MPKTSWTLDEILELFAQQQVSQDSIRRCIQPARKNQAAQTRPRIGTSSESTVYASSDRGAAQDCSNPLESPTIMASGFIVLRDGRCLAVRSAIHDAVLRSIAAAVNRSTSLYSWLLTQVPQESDIELGHAFVRSSDGTTVSRFIDTRGLTEANRQTFERAARLAIPTAGPYAPTGDVEFGLKRLCEMLDMCDKGRPPLELSDWTVVAPPCSDRVGPDWI